MTLHEEAGGAVEITVRARASRNLPALHALGGGGQVDAEKSMGARPLLPHAH